MSDEKLRELERAFQESGSEEDGVIWLHSLLREGEVAMIEVVAAEAVQPSRIGGHFVIGPQLLDRDVLKAVAALGRTPSVAVGLALTRLVLHETRLEDDRPERLVRAVAAWLEDGGGKEVVAVTLSEVTSITALDPIVNNPVLMARDCAVALGRLVQCPKAELLDRLILMLEIGRFQPSVGGFLGSAQRAQLAVREALAPHVQLWGTT
ncbi:MAG: hypothetical protein JKY65_27940 [Planctomycetes bacterium]|nr:hypothetical protein [Planctomycetota bacterium]